KKMHRIYSFEGRKLSLQSLAKFYRRAKALNQDGADKLSDQVVLSKWKAALGVPLKEKGEGKVIPLRLDFPLSFPATEAEIEKIVKAIVAQDAEHYPNGDASVLSASPKYLRQHYYRIEDQQVRLGTIINWFLRAKGMESTRSGASEAEIINFWK